MTCGGFFGGERFKKHEIDHRFGGHFRIFYCVGGHLNGHFLCFFKCSPLKYPPQKVPVCLSSYRSKFAEKIIELLHHTLFLFLFCFCIGFSVATEIEMNRKNHAETEQKGVTVVQWCHRSLLTKARTEPQNVDRRTRTKIQALYLKNHKKYLWYRQKVSFQS